MTLELAATGVVLDAFMDDSWRRGPRKGPGITGKVYRQRRRAHGRHMRRERALDRQANDHFRRYRQMAKSSPPFDLGWGEEVEFYPVETIVYSPVDWDEEQRKQDDVWRRIRQQGHVYIVSGDGVAKAAVDTGDDG